MLIHCCRLRKTLSFAKAGRVKGPTLFALNIEADGATSLDSHSTSTISLADSKEHNTSLPLRLVLLWLNIHMLLSLTAILRLKIKTVLLNCLASTHCLFETWR